MAEFLRAQGSSGELWAHIDGLSLCSSPSVAPRRFSSLLSPYADEADARQALLGAGTDTATITAEIRPERVRRGS